MHVQSCCSSQSKPIAFCHSCCHHHHHCLSFLLYFWGQRDWGRGCIYVAIFQLKKVPTCIFSRFKRVTCFFIFFIHMWWKWWYPFLLFITVQNNQPLPSKVTWLSLLKGNRTHSAFWVMHPLFCLLWPEMTCCWKLKIGSKCALLSPKLIPTFSFQAILSFAIARTIQLIHVLWVVQVVFNVVWTVYIQKILDHVT